MLVLDLPLEQRPRLKIIGRGTHGRTPVEHYRLNGLWCLHFYNYHAQLSLNRIELEIKPGDLGIIPADADLVYRFKGRSEHLFAHFEMADKGSTWAAPAIQPTGADHSMIYHLFEEAAGIFPTEPLRAEVRLWDLLWMATRRENPRDTVHPAVAETIRQIELRLHEPLLVEVLAREVGAVAQSPHPAFSCRDVADGQRLSFATAHGEGAAPVAKIFHADQGHRLQCWFR